MGPDDYKYITGLVFGVAGVQTIIIGLTFGLMYHAMNKRLELIEQRLNRIEDRLTTIEDRLNQVEQRLTAVETRLVNFGERITRLEERPPLVHP